MKNRFQNLWLRLGASGDSAAIYSYIEDAYTQPSRHYHNLKHIADCLQQFDETKTHLQSPDTIELAIWFHDIVYDTNAHDNEAQSANAARDTCLVAELPNDLANNVTNLIMATAHTAPPTNYDEQTIVDIDLSILGRSPQTYNNYATNIRKEYAAIPNDAYKVGRAKILQHFLNRPISFSPNTSTKNTKPSPAIICNMKSKHSNPE